jgi:hypothetical protein
MQVQEGEMGFLDYAALILGGGLIFSGIRAIRRQHVEVPEDVDGARAVRIGWLWIALGILFVLGVVFDISALKFFFKLFLESGA